MSFQPKQVREYGIYGGGTNKNYINGYNGYRNHRSHAIALPTAGMTWFQ